jgi:hypothetical protein
MSDRPLFFQPNGLSENGDEKGSDLESPIPRLRGGGLGGAVVIMTREME